MSRVIGFAIAAVVAIALALAFTHYFEQVTERVHVGFQGEAARNDHLAAQRFLQRLGHTAQPLRGLAQFDELRSNAVVWWSRAPSEGERARLLEWVKRGGHLILDVPQSQQALLQEIGVEQYWPGSEDDEEDAEEEATAPPPEAARAEDATASAAERASETEIEDAAREAAAAAAQSAKDEAAEAADQTLRECAPGRYACSDPIRVVAGTQTFLLEMEYGVYGARLINSDERAPQRDAESDPVSQRNGTPNPAVSRSATSTSAPLRSASDERGAVMLEYALGNGRVNVTTTERLFHNNRIGDHDHAAWLNYLIDAPSGVTRTVWFADVPLSASLGQWLRAHTWPALLAAAVAIALGLWRAVTRFGPLLPDQPPGRLSFRDHLVACGRFHWRHAAADRLLASVEHEAQRGQPGAAAAASKSRHFGGRAMEAPAFVQTVKSLQRRLLKLRDRPSTPPDTNKP